MFRQVIASHELLRALRALETFFTRVRSSVSLQLIAPRESFATKHPITHKRPFARVPSQMRSQMRSLSVNFVAARHMANVLLLSVAASIRHDAVGTSTGDAPHSRLHILIAAVDIYVDINRRLTRGRLQCDCRCCGGFGFARDCHRCWFYRHLISAR